MEDFDLDLARAELLEAVGRFSEAAELHLEEGNIQKAIGLFLRDPADTSTRRAYECLLSSLWAKFSLGVKPDPEDETLQMLLRVSQNFDCSSFSSPIHDEVSRLHLAFYSCAHNNCRSLSSVP